MFQENILLQMSDMIASAVGYSYNRKDRRDSQKWKNIIKKKTNIWEFAPPPPSSDRR